MIQKKSGIEELAEKLLSNIYISTQLKEVSIALEYLSQSKSFKNNAQTIASDRRLTNALKKTQMLYLFRDVESPILHDFFSDLFSQKNYTLFNSRQFDYFDQFVQTFQLVTEQVTVINLVTAIELQEKELIVIAKEFCESLGSQAIIHLQINEAIIGGAQIRIGNLVFDYSLRSKFQQFQRQWLSRIEKTSELVGSR